MNITHCDLINSARSGLSQRLSALNQVEPASMFQRIFTFADIRSSDALQQIETWLPRTEWQKRPALYAINANSIQTAEALSIAFASTKDAAQKVYNRPKRNTRHLPSTSLYVGSSIGNVSGRLKQHIHQCEHPGTYALQLHRWVPVCANLPSSYLEVTVWTFNDTSGLGLLQDIEDHLWQELTPMFGKRGPR